MEQKLIPHLFRTEFSKIVGVLCKTYGISQIQLAEDIASDTFIIAMETWSLKGIPDNPKAWLYTVAKNKTKDYFKRQSIFENKIQPSLKASNNPEPSFEIDLTESNIQDSQLKMLFAVCNPILSIEAQISLALRVLCGFGIEEIASALLTSKSTINKRLHRSKETFKKLEIELELPNENEILERSQNVLTVIYLLYNEGYYSAVKDVSVQKEVCLEAMRLLYLFLDHQNMSEANALMALFCFHASRFDARNDEMGISILYEEQDSEKWSTELIAKGESYLKKSVTSNTITKYHIEATIAFWHTRKEESPEKWENILRLYNSLLQMEYSPIVALNRTYALSRVKSKEVALKEALKIQLEEHHLYHSLLAELYSESNVKNQIDHLNKALELANTDSERRLIATKLDSLKKT